MSDREQSPSAGSWRGLRIGSVLACIISVLFILRALPIDGIRELLEQFLTSLGPWGPVAFVLIYIVATVAMLPASMFTLLGAALFGFVVGYVVVTIGSVLGAASAFLVARYAARQKVEQLAAEYPKFAAIDQAVSDGGWKIVALLRLSPAVPFNLQNYLYGLTSIRFWPYVLTSWLAMIPGTLMYVYLGHAAREAVAAEGKTPAEWTLLIVGLIATVAVTVYVTRLARSKLNNRADITPEEPQQKAAERFPVRLVLAAAVLVALTVAATAFQDTLAGFFPETDEVSQKADNADEPGD